MGFRANDPAAAATGECLHKLRNGVNIHGGGLAGVLHHLWVVNPMASPDYVPRLDPTCSVILKPMSG